MEPIPTSQVEQLIEQLYSSQDPQATKQIQESLQVIQRQPFAWETASQLLLSTSVNAKFFGAHTFLAKIGRDWGSLPEERIDWLRQELLQAIARSSNGPAFIVTKLCQALTAFAIQAVPNHWSNFIVETCQYFETFDQSLPENALQNQLIILEFLTIVPEDVTTAQLIGGHKLQILQEMKDGLSYVLSKLESILTDFNDQSVPDRYRIELKKKGLKCFQSWIQYGISLEDVHKLMHISAYLMTNDDFLEDVAEVLIEIMQMPKVTSWRGIERNLKEYICSQWFMAKLDSSIEEEDEQTARVLGRIAVTFGETFADNLTPYLGQPSMIHYLQLIMRLTGYPGYFGADQEVGEITLNFWYVLQETIADLGLLPLDKRPNHDLEYDANSQETISAAYKQLVFVLRDKAMIPPDHEYNSWSKDVRDKFRIYRRDIADTLNSPYFVIGAEMPLLLLNEVILELSRQGMEEYNEQRLEATFFCLRSISDEIPADSSGQVDQLFDSNIFNQIPVNSSPRLQNSVLGTIGSFADWLKHHPQYLLTALNYIVPALSNAKLAPTAATALKNICDTCRSALVEGVDSLIALYKDVVKIGVEATVKQKVVESIAAVIQVFPPERMIAPLMVLTADIVHAIQHSLVNTATDQVAAAKNVQAQLQYLTACCRGLQSPDDDYQSLIDRNTAYDMFASGSINALYESVPGASEFSQTINDTITQIVYIYCNDPETMEILCQYLDAGLRESQADAGGVNDEDVKWDPLSMEEFPDITHSYFGLLSRVIRRCPLILFQIPSDILNSIFSIAVAGMTLQERLALRAVMSFIAEMVAIDASPDSELRHFVDDVMMNIGYSLTEKLLLGIGGLVPRSLMSHLVDVLYKLTGRYLQAERHWIQTLLSQEGFPSPHVTLHDKELFMKSILATRSAKRFKEVTTSFSVKCRKMDNTLFGTAV
ncbi:unnamed protein product [Umbelopsis sp. WA50703]